MRAGSILAWRGGHASEASVDVRHGLDPAIRAGIGLQLDLSRHIGTVWVTSSSTIAS